MFNHGAGDPLNSRKGGSNHSIQNSLKSFGDPETSDDDEEFARDTPRPLMAPKRASYTSSFNHNSFGDTAMERDSSLRGLEEQAVAMGALMGNGSHTDHSRPHLNRASFDGNTSLANVRLDESRKSHGSQDGGSVRRRFDDDSSFRQRFRNQKGGSYSSNKSTRRMCQMALIFVGLLGAAMVVFFLKHAMHTKHHAVVVVDTDEEENSGMDFLAEEAEEAAQEEYVDLTDEEKVLLAREAAVEEKLQAAMAQQEHVTQSLNDDTKNDQEMALLQFEADTLEDEIENLQSQIFFLQEEESSDSPFHTQFMETAVHELEDKEEMMEAFLEEDEQQQQEGGATSHVCECSCAVEGRPDEEGVKIVLMDQDLVDKVGNPVFCAAKTTAEASVRNGSAVCDTYCLQSKPDTRQP